MAKVDLITLTGITASDGSIVASGATMKFDTEFFAATTKIKINPKLYRNRELFEGGYLHVFIPESFIPPYFILDLTDEEFYSLTPLILYEKVGEHLNNHLGGNYFELKIIED